MTDESLEGRVAKIEGIVSQMNERLNHLTTDMKTQFRWLMTFILASWLSTIGAIVGAIITMAIKLP